MSKQINFLVSPRDIPAIDAWLQESRGVIFDQPSIAELEGLPSLMGYNFSKGWSMVFISASQFLQNIKSDFIQQQGYYLIDSAESEVIEFRIPQIANNTLKVNRLFYEEWYYEGDSKIFKSKEFIEFAATLVRSFKSKFLLRYETKVARWASLCAIEDIESGVKPGFW